MTTTTIHTKSNASSALRRASHGFTLVEALIGMSLGLMVMAGIMKAFLMFGRSAANAVNYSIAETQVRRAIEDFSHDLRMAKAITWNSATSITLTVPDNYTSTGNRVTYACDTSSSGATAHCFYRVPGDASSTAARTIYIQAISSFAFERYNRLNNAAATDAETKRVRLTLNVRRTGNTLVAATTTLVSASYTLRNKVIN